jgi:hypothetical protein
MVSEITGYQTGHGVDIKTGGGENFNGFFYGLGENTTLSVLVSDTKTFTGDYVQKNGEYVSRHPSLGELVSHEVLGHGTGRIYSSNEFDHKDALQMSNLYLRAQGIPLYRDGSDHKGNRRSSILHKREASGFLVFIKVGDKFYALLIILLNR